MAADDQLEQLLKEHSKYFERTDGGKVKCLCNGHEFPARFEVLAPFVKGNKFATMRKRYDAEHDLEKYEPFIVQSKNFPHMLYCALTGQLMDKSVEAVKVHMKGKKFQRNKELFAADKKELQPEPDVDTLMAEVMGRKASTGKSVDGASDGEADEGEGEEEDGDGMEEDSDDADADADMAQLQGQTDEHEDEEMAAAVQNGKQAGKGKRANKKTAAGGAAAGAGGTVVEVAGGKNSKKGTGKAAVQEPGQQQQGAGTQAKKQGASPSVGVKRGREASKPSAARALAGAAAVKAAGNGVLPTTGKKAKKGKGPSASVPGAAAAGGKPGAAQDGEDEKPELWVPEEFASLEGVGEEEGEEGEEQGAAAGSRGGVKHQKQAPGKQGQKATGKQAAGGQQQRPSATQGKQRQQPVVGKTEGGAQKNGKKNVSRPSKPKKAKVQ